MPDSYGGRAIWGEEMSRTHRQIRCPGCGLFVIWKPRKGAPKLPPIEYRLVHRHCGCCEGDPKCGCEFHPEPACSQSGLRRLVSRIHAALTTNPEETDQ
jgi:DNA-directed RNA polymerase subunit RPC12/RpoP